MTELLKETEALPLAYPSPPGGLSVRASAIPEGVLWQRIESYVGHRWTARQVVWTIGGPGEWVPRLVPATVTATEVWDGAAWVAVSLGASPLGGLTLPDCGPYRITADVGAGTTPEAVLEAFRRLAEYSAEVADETSVAGHPANKSGSLSVGEFRESFNRPASWAALAMQNSGAADLLRPWRRA